MMCDVILDLCCDIEQMIVVGDWVVVYLYFCGYFIGVFNGMVGCGQVIDFIVIDIYWIDQGWIVENWYIEDNLMLMCQFGFVG